MGLKKQFCLNRHDTFATGREKNGTCVKCSAVFHKKIHEANPQKQHARSQSFYKEHKDAENIKARARYHENPERQKIWDKNYRRGNSEQAATYRRNYERIHKYSYIKLKKQIDPLFKLRLSLRTRLSSVLFCNSKGKTARLLQSLGCTLNQLKIYLENQFSPGMSWDNHSVKGWHIDHITPLASARTVEDIYRLFHYTNLQPLWAKDNLRKGAN